MNSNSVIVEREVVIPSGYEVAETKMRYPMVGEYYLNHYNRVCYYEGGHVVPSVILNRLWQPVVGKLYLFENHKGRINSNRGVLREFKKRKGFKYVDENGVGWNYCKPVNTDNLGV